MTLTEYFTNEKTTGPVVYDSRTFAGELQRAKDYQTMGLITSRTASGLNTGDEPAIGLTYSPTDVGKPYVHVFSDPTTNRGSSIQPCFAAVKDLAITKTTTADGQADITLASFSGTLAPANWVADANKSAIADVWAMRFETFQAGIITPDDSATPPTSGHVQFTLSMSKDARGAWVVNGFSR